MAGSSSANGASFSLYSSTGRTSQGALGRAPKKRGAAAIARPMSSAARSTSASFDGGLLAGSAASDGAIGRGVVAEPGGAGDLAAFGLDRLQLVEPDLVDLGGSSSSVVQLRIAVR